MNADPNKITVAINTGRITPKDKDESGGYIAFTQRQTKSGHTIMIYEIDYSPIVAKNRLKRLLGIK